TVPDVSGRSFDDAAGALRDLGLVPVRADAFSDTVPKDKVIGTTPPASSSVDKGTRVTVTVSKGPDVVTVPDVFGRSVNDATKILQQAGLDVGQVYGPGKGRVFQTNPAAGSQAHRGSSVNLYTI